jgi:hypothetical protein
MSKPIAYASTALDGALKLLEVNFTRPRVDDLARLTVRTFLEDARREGRFDNAAIDQLLADISS